MYVASLSNVLSGFAYHLAIFSNPLRTTDISNCKFMLLGYMFGNLNFDNFAFFHVLCNFTPAKIGNSSGNIIVLVD